MGSCLGVYLGDKVVKYAKLTQDDRNKKFSLSSYGTKFVVGDKSDVISDIISETGSTDDFLSLNLTDGFRINREVLKQLGKADIQSVVSLEISDHASNEGMNEKLIDYRYKFLNSTISNDNYSVEIVAVDKNNLKKYAENDRYNKNLIGIYPEEFVIPSLARGVENTLIINVNESTKLMSLIGGKLHKVLDMDISMKDILYTIAEQEGSYDRACEVCKGINVLADDGLTPELERIIEPAVQDLLNRIKIKLDESKIKYTKIYLNGLINLFINIDVLFEQFFGITTEKLVPAFIEPQELPSNISEVIEANEAIALAYEGLTNVNNDINFVTRDGGKAKFKLFEKKDKLDSGKKAFVMPNINVEKIEKALLLSNVTAGIVLAGYAGFSAVYNGEMTKLQNDLDDEITRVVTETNTIKEDVNYVKNNTNQYTSFNNYIYDIKDKITTGKIGKYSTYNVANFMQKIARYIPSNVELQSISSDNNKSVSIVARSTSYSELGYFVSQLKLKGILNNVSTGKVETGTVITVTIGGDLP